MCYNQCRDRSGDSKDQDLIPRIHSCFIPWNSCSREVAHSSTVDGTALLVNREVVSFHSRGSAARKAEKSKIDGEREASR